MRHGTISAGSGKAARLSVEGLVVARGAKRLAGPVDFTLEGGEALAVTGPNGVGKSTFLRIAMGLLPLDIGRIAVLNMAAGDGEPARTLAEAAHYLGHRNAMKPGETVAANLGFWRRFLGAPGMEADEALEAVGLGHAAALPFGFLSAGQQRRAALARLLVARRPVWLLDEPTAALDAASEGLFEALARRHLAAGGILVAATHRPLNVATRELALERQTAGAEAAALDAADAWT